MSGRGGARILIVVLGAVLVAGALSACVRNVVNPALDWLGGREGIASVELIASTSSAWSSSGAIRGELEEGLDDEALARLVGEVLDYESENPSVGIRLGNDRFDFAVGESPARTQDRIDVWRGIVGTPDLVNGFVTNDSEGSLQVQARGMRESAGELYAALDGSPAIVRLGLFQDEAALEANWRDSYAPGDDPVASTLYWTPDCDADRAITDLALDLGTRDDVVGGWFELCTGFWIGLAEPEDFTTRVPELRAELDGIPAVAESGFPVTLQTSSQSDPAHVAVVTPNDPAVYGIFAVLEDPGLGDAGLWRLDADGVLTWKDYGLPTSDLVARLAASPASTALSFIEVTGDGSTVGGAIGELPGLLEQADALDAATDAIGSVHLSAVDGSFYLDSAGLEGPDTAAAATALRVSGLWVGRTIVVRYLNGYAELRDGVAEPLDDYTDPEVLQSFLDAWAATDSATVAP